MPNATPGSEISDATPTMLDDDPTLDRLFNALADPTRRSILTRLTAGEATMSELAAPFDMSLPGVSKHVTVLEDAGLVQKWRTGRARRCRLRGEALQPAAAWLTERSAFWTETLDRFAAFVETESEPDSRPGPRGSGGGPTGDPDQGPDEAGPR